MKRYRLDIFKLTQTNPWPQTTWSSDNVADLHRHVAAYGDLARRHGQYYRLWDTEAGKDLTPTATV